MTSHIVLFNPGKALFNFQMELFFYILFHLIRIFSDSHKVYTERQKTCPVRCLFCLSDLRKRRKKICCKWGKVLLCSLLTFHLTKIGQKFCFLSAWKKISFGATKWSYPLASSAPDMLSLAFILCMFILWQLDKWHGSISAATCYHWTPPLNKSHSFMLLGPILLQLPSTDVLLWKERKKKALLFFFPVTS